MIRALITEFRCWSASMVSLKTSSVTSFSCHPTMLCSRCRRLSALWCSEKSELEPYTYTSRKALQASAKRCRLCSIFEQLLPAIEETQVVGKNAEEKHMAELQKQLADPNRIHVVAAQVASKAGLSVHLTFTRVNVLVGNTESELIGEITICDELGL